MPFIHASICKIQEKWIQTNKLKMKIKKKSAFENELVMTENLQVT